MGGNRAIRECFSSRITHQSTVSELLLAFPAKGYSRLPLQEATKANQVLTWEKKRADKFQKSPAFLRLLLRPF
jgi:hypothetical protein